MKSIAKTVPLEKLLEQLPNSCTLAKKDYLGGKF